LKLSFVDALGSALDSLRYFRRREYAPFFWMLAIELACLGLTTQLQHAWAMTLIAPIAKAAGGEGSLHYPPFFAYLPVLLGWVEGVIYSVLGCVLIPLSLLRLYSRSDRALSLGAGVAMRLAGAVIPTLLATLAGLGAIWGWQRHTAPLVAKWITEHSAGPPGVFLSWLATTVGSYAIIMLLLYVPIAAVQARTNPVRAIGRGLRFGVRAWIPTIVFGLLFGIPALLVQYLLEKQGAHLISRVAPEIVVAFLALYVTFSSVATYLTYVTGARFYTISRGEE
jgi:hypothetical protein